MTRENVRLVLRNVKNEDVVRRQVVSAPGAIVSHAEGSAEIVLLTEKQGGRHASERKRALRLSGFPD